MARRPARHARKLGNYDARRGLWFIPAERAVDCVLDLRAVADTRLQLDGNLGEAISRSMRMLALSRAMEPSDDFVLTDAVARDLSTRPFQLAGVEYGVESVRTGAGCFLWGTMGSGKTTVALAILEQLAQDGHDVYPALVIPPSGIKTNWAREIAAVLPAPDQLGVRRDDPCSAAREAGRVDRELRHPRRARRQLVGRRVLRTWA